MTTDPPAADHLGNGDLYDDGHVESDSTAGPRLWWAVHAPETYALAALTFAVIGLLGPQTAYLAVQAVLLNVNEQGPRLAMGLPGAIQGAIGVLAVALAAMSIGREDEDVTWSAPVARAAVLVGILAVVFGLVTAIAAMTADAGGSGYFAP